jgi:hypothetical protein
MCKALVLDTIQNEKNIQQPKAWSAVSTSEQKRSANLELRLASRIHPEIIG